MKLFKKLRKKIENFKNIRIRKSRKVGIFVERVIDNIDETNNRTRSTLNSITPCENFSNNIISVWKCGRNEDRVRILKFRQNFTLGKFSDKYKKVLPTPRKIQNRRIGRRSSRVLCHPRKLDKIEEETNHNHSAKEFEHGDLIPRSKSDEKYDKIYVAESKKYLLEPEKSERFLKYIPVDADYKLIRKRVRDERIGSSWIEIQAWCSKYQAKRDKQDQKQPATRKSQTLLPSKRKPTFSIYAEDVTFDHNRDPTICENDILYHPRFGYHSNQEYFLAINGGSSPEARCNRIQFCISPEVLSASIQLCHQKTEMILACIRSYFRTLADIELMWVDSLQKHLPTKSMKSCFPLDVGEILDSDMGHARAVLYVTEEVATILRHPDTYFLATLAFTAGIKRDELLILPLHVKPKHFSVTKR